MHMAPKRTSVWLLVPGEGTRRGPGGQITQYDWLYDGGAYCYCLSNRVWRTFTEEKQGDSLERGPDILSMALIGCLALLFRSDCFTLAKGSTGYSGASFE